MVENGLLKPEVKKDFLVTGKKVNSTASAANIDFEIGDYTGWNLFSGDNMTNSNGPLNYINPMTAGSKDSIYISNIYNNSNNCNNSDTSGRQGIITASVGNDPVSGIPLASPMGGNYVARLNRLCNNYEGSILQQTFAVTPGQKVLNYSYAVILEDGGHAQGQQCYFSAYVLNSIGDTIPGSLVYMQAANGTTPGFYPCLVGSGYTYYKNWTPVSVDLTAYIGQNVTVRYIASDCIYGGHSGSAYIDARLDSTTAIPNVWPGDANYDLVADMNDLLYIGWAYGATGTPRTGATLNWQAQPSANWGQSTIYGTEFKHADCNGDGTINDNDTLAILQNYSLQHAFRKAQPQQINSVSNYRNLQITPGITSVGPNQPLTLSVSMPANTTATNNIYGIAFKLQVPAQYISSLTSNDLTNCYLGTQGSNMMLLSKPLISNGTIDYCLVRKDHQDATGGGNLININLLSTNFSTNGAWNFNITDIRAVTYEGAYLPVGSANVKVNFVTNTTSINQLEAVNGQIRVYPNPTANNITIQSSTELGVISIYNALGELSLQMKSKNSQELIDISKLPVGVYTIQVQGKYSKLIKE
jgi:hypothetical protein